MSWIGWDKAEEVARLSLQGATVREAAAAAGVSVCAAHGALRRLDIPAEKRGRGLLVSQIINRARCGESAKDIARAMGRSRGNVYAILQRAGIRDHIKHPQKCHRRKAPTKARS